ncbi:ankyrin repeat and SOCS box protein 3-like [Thrips palmi]|uniref:Ankyrin repeat and SOCS box protein 3-like n=1 Tax=Thrips palmi TaxID=161013 RepID=A0A6P9AC30_THRPL|nr:ankyrin repeat and SOCS box protein 3-like [Thrips palmi]XP_034255734.1 ankyrin repeat and SOCS box protein 3-like [Thrips palmi]XP_034255735.1 ankyrin repeat and SOCS box protein 3-like [Thrips palmi]XP_034255736.1 ankyrin repeat and SOCS box protein 3-like [Thrips palmi]XP_034255737.1 ankyrin repeat and SOCS box protein 3-like [Thrips palmi]
MNEWDNLFVYPPTSLNYAASNGDVDLLRVHLQAGKRPDTMDHRGWTPLHVAAANDKLECIDVLLEDSRTNPLQRTHSGDTAAELSVISKASLPVVKRLLENGGRTVMKPFMLHVACYNGSLDVVKLLVSSGCDINVHEEINEQTPLHRAAEGKRQEVLQYLLSIGAKVNLGDSSACTPLFEAVQQDSLECAKILLQAGAKPNRRTCDGVTPLMMACQKGNCEMVKLLLSFGAKPNLYAKDYSMALTLAVHGGWVDIVRILMPLLCHNTVVNASRNPSAGAVSLFCVAIDSESEECLSILLEADLPLEVKMWPLHRKFRDMQPHVKYTKCGAMSFLLMDKMSEFGDRTIAILEKLIQAGFPVNVKKKSELSPLVAALLFPLLQPPVGQVAILDRLVSAGAEVDYRSMPSNKLPDALLAACLKCNGLALKALLPFSAVCPHQLLEHFIEAKSTIFCYFLIAEASLGDDFSGLEAKVNNLIQNKPNKEVWLNFLPRLRESFPSLQGIARRKVRECIRSHTANTQEFLQCIENLNVPSLIKSYLRFRV